MTSDMSNTPYHGEEISADTYVALTRHQFNLESLGERLQRIENTTAGMKDKWRRGDEAMRDFTVLHLKRSERMSWTAWARPRSNHGFRGAMTTSTYVSCIVFDLISSRFKVSDMFSAYVTCMVGIEHLFEDNF
ncbi:hypothetical protein F2Q69_00030093 [Brassica cretica]|uniref:Uncharacterized protein n=1 Tax=Brassica cretica TaxID=69181 RepID=A0A8S9S4T3_BRACR|nr:hypothetical protein F2Q69_00030093 [Brassica cretica]